MGITDWKLGRKRYRVVRKVAGVIHQRYFTADEYDEALQYDDKLKRLQEKARQVHTEAARRHGEVQNYQADRYAAPRRTLVSGLQINFQERGGYPCIVIACTGFDGKKTHTHRLITPTSRTVDEAWRESCKLLAKRRDLKRVPSKWIKAKPSLEQWDALAKFYRQEYGRQIDQLYLDWLRDGYERQ